MNFSFWIKDKEFKIIRVFVREGQAVLVLEAMKMQNEMLTIHQDCLISGFCPRSYIF